MTETDPQWIPPKQAAEKLGVSTRTLLRLADTGQITVITLPSGHHRYEAHDIERLANETTEHPTAVSGTE